MGRALAGPEMDEHRKSALVEDIEFMLEMGESKHRIAARLGMTWKGVEKALKRDKERRA